MLWAGIDETTGRLERLQRNVGDALAGMGLREEQRGFRPHITIARIKFVRDPAHFRRIAGLFSETDFGRTHADDLVAYTSDLTSDGPVYTPIARAPIGI